MILLFLNWFGVIVLHPPYTQRGFPGHVLDCARHTTTKRVQVLHLPPTRSYLRRDAWPQTLWCHRRHLCRWPTHRLRECGDWWRLPGWRWEELIFSLRASQSAQPAHETTDERLNLASCQTCTSGSKDGCLKKKRILVFWSENKQLGSANLKSAHTALNCVFTVNTWAPTSRNTLLMFKQYLLVFQSEVTQIIELILQVHITVQTQVIFGSSDTFINIFLISVPLHISDVTGMVKQMNLKNKWWYIVIYIQKIGNAKNIQTCQSMTKHNFCLALSNFL